MLDYGEKEHKFSLPSSIRAKVAHRSHTVPELMVHPPHSPNTPASSSSDGFGPQHIPASSIDSPQSNAAQTVHGSPISSKYRPSLSRSHTDLSVTSSSDQVALYRSYARETGNNEVPYEAFVRGWVYHPHLNRKGKLMIAAIERLVGNPGKYSSLADAAAAHVSEQHVKHEVDGHATGTHSRATSPASPSFNVGTANAEHRSTQSDATSPFTGTQSQPGSRVPSSDNLYAEHGKGSISRTTSTTTFNTGHPSYHCHGSAMRSTSPPSTSSGSTNISSSNSWLSFRPPMFRSRSSKSSVKSPGSPGEGSYSTSNSPSHSIINSAANSVPGSAFNSAFNSAANSAVNSANNSAVSSAANSASNSAASTAPNSPNVGTVTDHFSFSGLKSGHDADIPHISLQGNQKSRPEVRRTATFGFESFTHHSSGSSNHKEHKDKSPKTYSPSHWARKEQKHTIRERMAAVSHRSLSMRDVRLVLESEPDSQDRTLRRSFWATTDESGRFSINCPVPFKPVTVRAYSGDATQAQPLIYVPTGGISVISDIDDTVRHSGVTKSKRELLQNVLARSFDDCRIEGVSDWFEHMHKAGAHFHYVSNSPWQLYDVISGYLSHHRFPEGSMHLKKYAGVFDGLTEPAKGRKRASLEKIMRDFPNHKFILVGDSGEADLEAYAEAARTFPDQVVAIYIRDISLSADEPLSVYERDVEARHKRLHSIDHTNFVDTHNQTRFGPISSSAPPVLPPRVRHSNKQYESITNSLDSLEVNPPELNTQHTTPPPPPPARKPVSAGLSKLAIETTNLSQDTLVSHEGNQAGTPISPKQPSFADVPTIKAVKSSNEHTHSSGQTHSDYMNLDEPESPRESLRDARRISVPLNDIDDDVPKLPARPKLLRRTSSKLMEGMTTLASASSHAAHRLLGPQLPPRPHKGGSNGKDREVVGPQAVKPPKPSKSSISLTSSKSKHASSHPLSFDEAQRPRSFTPSGSYDRRFSVPLYDHRGIENDPEGLVLSTQDYAEYERVVDKRSDHWRARVVKQRRLLPQSVALKMWRNPSDVETDSLELINEFKK